MQKKLYIKLLILPLTLFIVISIVSVYRSRDGAWSVNNDSNISIERIDLSIKSNDGTIVAIIYYDKPIISNNSVPASIINAFFDREYQEWSEGSNRLTHFQDGLMTSFISNVKDMRESFGDDILKKQPLIYTVDTEIVFMDQDILSVRQIVFWSAGGPNSCYYFGSSFDLKTGELLALDHFVAEDTNVFYENVVKYLADKSLSFEFHSNIKEIQQIYGLNKDRISDFFYTEHQNLFYEYFYDGEYIYIILNYGIFHNCGSVMKWNGKVGDEFNASLLGYIRQSDGSIKVIEY